MMRKNLLCRLFAILFLLSFWAPSAWAADARPQALVRPTVGATPLSPFLDYYIDESLSMDIEEASAPNRADLYKPLVLEDLPHAEGITWLRFTLAAAPADGRGVSYLLDMGQSIPGVPILYDPERNELSGALEWRENAPAQRNILLLPEAGPTPVTCYIRIDGLPGPWFSPIIRTPQDAASNWSSLSRTGAILAMGVVMLLCLLRGLSENGQWRVWTALYVGVALAQAILGMPAIAETVGVKSLAAILAPGIALMLLPHVGRHLMRTNTHSRFLDIQLLLLSLPGAALAIWPLVPGWNWLDRWLDLWPVAIAILIPTALGAWIAGLGGSRRFLLGCLIPPVFAALSIIGLEFGVPANLLASGPIWGVALSALLIAATKSPADMYENVPIAEQTPEEGEIPENEEILTLDTPLDDPNLRLASPEATPAENAEESAQPVPPTNLAAEETALEEREKALREPIEDMLREGAALDGCSLPASARLYARRMISAAKRLGSVMANDGEFPAEPEEPAKSGPFNLQRVLRAAHDAVASVAEINSVSLSWHMPPHLAREYRGKWGDLEKTLTRLLESSVRASSRGVVRLSARLVPESTEPGHILFSITDNGSGIPPTDRSSLALSKAWELVRANGGYMGMESGRDGTTIAFSLRFAPIPEVDDSKAEQPHVVVACEDAEERRKIGDILTTAGCRVSEAANMHEALVTQSIDPAPLLITAGTLALPTAADLARRFTAMAKQAGFSQCYALAITSGDSTWPELKKGGFTHAMVEPFDPAELTRIALDLGRSDQTPAGEAKQPQPEETTLAEPAGEESQKQEPSLIPGAATRKSQSPSSIPEPAIIPDHATSPEEKKDSLEEKPLSMLADQEMEISRNFEGPDWLEPAPDIPEQNIARTTEEKPAPDSAPGRMDRGEWVGEPMPVPKSGPARKSPPAAKTPAEEKKESGTDFEEWVGEPMPVPRTAAPKNTLTDFILGVEPNKEEQTGQAAGKQDNVAKASAPVRKPTEEDFIVEKENAESVALDPVISGLVQNLDAYMIEAQKSFESGNCELLALITGQIASESERFGLRWLARFAKCVEQAAQASDLKAVKDLLPELAIAIERNKVALLQKR